MSIRQLPSARWTVPGTSGGIASGWYVYTYQPGTSTAKATYTDYTGNTANTNPIVLDSRGEATIWWDGTYKVAVYTGDKDAGGVLVWTQDNYGEGTTSVLQGNFNLVKNGSFEQDTNGDGVPDDWTVVEYTGGTVALDTTDQIHGAQSLKFTSVGTGGGYATSDLYEVEGSRTYPVSFVTQSSVATVHNKVDVIWYTAAQAVISTSTVHDDTATNPTSWTDYAYAATAPATARYAAVRVFGCVDDDAQAGSTWYDNVIMDAAAAGLFPNVNAAVNASDEELDYLDIATLGTGAASKAVVLDAGEDYVWPPTGILTYGVLKDPAGTTILPTGSEINLLDGAEIRGWNIDNAVYASKSADISAQETSVAAIAFRADGTSMYILGLINDTVYQYTLSTAWDVSTASYASKSFSIATEEGTPGGLAFSSDGTAMYIVGSVADTVYQYTLSTAWDVSTAASAAKSVSVAAQEGQAGALAFSSDGTAMYVIGSVNVTVYQYTLATAWDVSTASYASKSFAVSSYSPSIQGLVFKSDGMAMYMVGSTTDDTVYQFSLTTAWDVSTAVSAYKTFSVASQDTIPSDLSMSSDGTKMYIAGFDTDAIYQYKTGVLVA